jgi:hypothetical protein
MMGYTRLSLSPVKNLRFMTFALLMLAGIVKTLHDLFEPFANAMC